MVDLDLDGLTKKTKTIKHNGEIITIGQPSLQSLVDLLDVAKNMQGLEGENDVAKITEQVAKFKEKLDDLVPELKGSQLSIEHMMAVLNLIIELATPSEQGTDVVKEVVGEVKKKE